MSNIAELQSRLAEALRAASQRRTEERSVRTAQMTELDSRRAHFEQTAVAWVRELVYKRLQELARAFPHAGEVEMDPNGWSARLAFRRTDEFPVSASLTISVVPDADYERAEMRIERRSGGVIRKRSSSTKGSGLTSASLETWTWSRRN